MTSHVDTKQTLRGKRLSELHKLSHAGHTREEQNKHTGARGTNAIQSRRQTPIDTATMSSKM